MSGTERIVVGVDGSDGSLAAMKWALDEARVRDLPLHVMLGWDFHPSWAAPGLGSMFAPAYSAPGDAPPVAPGGTFVSAPGSLPVHTPQSTELDAAGAASNALEAVVNLALEGDAPPAKLTREVVQGPAAKVLLDEVTASDLLVVGSRGHGGFVGALLGSVSHQVVSQARCPVVVVPSPQDSTQTE
jgi:nucleotide-binding universal stress UspA family protein